MSEIEVERMETWLRSAGRAFAYPETPSLASGVLARLAEREAEGPVAALRERLAAPALRLAAAGVAAAAVVFTVSLAVPQSREALADFFGLSHVRVEVGPVLGPEPPVLAPENYARLTTLEEAQARVDFPIALPRDEDGPMLPDAVFLRDEGSTAPAVILVYDDEDFDLTQSRTGFFGKGGPPEVFEEVEVGGRPAIWIEEGGHVAWFTDATGRLTVEARRLVERATLLWEGGLELTFRLETSLSQAEAIALAESVR